MATKKRDNETGEIVDAAEVLRQTMRQCAAELEEAIALKVGVMDSDSKVLAVTNQRLGAMQSVAARLREA
jgi:uncharacterized protein YbjT (DUF2867 family)